MKKALLVFALVPCTVFAQEAQMNGQTGKPAVNIHYEKVRMQSEVMTSSFSKMPGDLRIANDTIYIPGPVEINMNITKKTRHRKEDEVVIAENVRITDASNPVS